jgi:hypothetical protein
MASGFEFPSSIRRNSKTCDARRGKFGTALSTTHSFPRTADITNLADAAERLVRENTAVTTNNV